MMKTPIPFLVAAIGAATMALTYPAFAEDRQEVIITLTGTTFEPAEVKVASGKPLLVRFRNMNAKPAEFESNDLGIEKIAAANSEVVMRVADVPKGKFLFFDEFQEDAAKGYFLAE